MNPKDELRKAIALVGSMRQLGEHLGVTKGAVSQWLKENRQIPIKHCRRIEELVRGAVLRENLNPDFYLEKDHSNSK